MQLKGNRFIFISLAVHAIFFALLFFLHKQENKTETVSIEILPTTNRARVVTEHSAHTASTSGDHKIGGSSAGFGKYLPHYQFAPSAINSGGDTYAADPLKDDSRSEWGSGAGTFARVADTNLFQVIYERVDYNLSYPGILARHKIDGTVNARIVLLDTGKCDWHKILIQGHQPYLELYVMDLLKRVCQQNYKPYLGARQITNVDLSFQFDINENNDHERVKSEKFIVGNTLMFYRNSHQSVMQWELGPFHGMFPVPMIYLNLPWIQENWDRLVHDKDPLSEFKKEFGES